MKRSTQTTPGDQGKWFAAAKDAMLYDEALALASRSALGAAERHGGAAEVKDRVRKMVAAEGVGERFVTKVLGRELGL